LMMMLMILISWKVVVGQYCQYLALLRLQTCVIVGTRR
jgi:hypothetical protein